MRALPFVLLLSAGAAAQHSTFEASLSRFEAKIAGDKNNGYGLGFSIRKLESGVRAIGHGGSVAGYNAYLVFDPDSKIVVAMLRNYNRGATSLGAAAKEVLGELVVASKK
jgi:CubicO group peptidase (beta-lactamase class C family)